MFSVICHKQLCIRRPCYYKMHFLHTDHHQGLPKQNMATTSFFCALGAGAAAAGATAAGTTAAGTAELLLLQELLLEMALELLPKLLVELLLDMLLKLAAAGNAASTAAGTAAARRKLTVFFLFRW